MKNSFDELSRKLGEGVSRRDMLKVAVAGILGTMLAPLGNGIALAEEESPDTARTACIGVPAYSFCSGSHPDCCYCFYKHGTTRKLCGVNGYCSDEQQCGPGYGGCPRGFFCCDSACSTPTCVKKCGKHTSCYPYVEEARVKHLGLTNAG